MPDDIRERTRAAYDRVASDYATLLEDELAADPLHAFLLEDFARSTSGPVIDAGCGPGRATRFLADRGVDCEGVDLSPGMIAEARRRNPDLDFRVGTLDTLDVPAGSLGGILAWYSLIHTPEHELPAVISEFRRALAAGGRILLAFQVGLGQAVTITRAYGHDLDYVAYRHSPDAITRTLEAAGFSIVLRTERSATPPERTAQAYIVAELQKRSDDPSDPSNPGDRLTTPRLLLRCPRASDVDAITAACQDPEIQRRVPIPVPYRREHAVDYVADYCIGGWQTGARCTWAITANGTFAGVVGLDPIADGSAAVGYWMAPEQRGHGYLSEAVSAVVDYGFDALGLERIEWRAFAGNTGSARVAQRNGFRFEGVRRSASVGRAGREDDWVGSLLAGDDREPQPWPVLGV